jgi:hypothetical protein
LRDMVLAIFDVNNISPNQAVEFLKTTLKSAIDIRCGSAVALLKKLIKIQSKFNDPIPIRRAGYNGTLDMYDFVEYEL